jgi:predicted RNA-binding Zn-ribbon protein involved in translation (DUF1610 family)
MRIYHEVLMNVTCPAGHVNDVASGRAFRVNHRADGTFEGHFECPDCGATMTHWVRCEANPADSDPDTLLH